MRTLHHPFRRTLRLLGLLIPLIPLLLLGGVRVAHAQDTKAAAKQHFAAGEARFRAGDFRVAITEFAAADALVPSPILSYNIGLCHERLGEDELAVQRYRDYLTRRPDASNRAQVEERIAAAQQRLAAKAAPAPLGPVPPAAPAPTPTPAGKNGPAAHVEGPAAPAPQGEGPAVPAPAPSGPVDDSLGKRLPPRPGTTASAPPAGGLVGMGEPPVTGDAEAAPLPTPIDSKPTKKAKPLYKEWWFWAVVGVSAIIVIDMVGDSSSSSAQSGVTNGAVLLRF